MASHQTTDLPHSHGVAAINLIDQIVRNKIYNCQYWKEKCYAIDEVSLIERAIQLKAIGGCYGPSKLPSDFLCLVYKMLQMQPDKEVVCEYLKSEHKYLKALSAFYIRLTYSSIEIYKQLELLYSEYSKLKVLTTDVKKTNIIHFDELIDDLLHDEFMFELAMPVIIKRFALENQKLLQPYESLLSKDIKIDDALEPPAKKLKMEDTEKVVQLV
jgi:pre-mRNA-splicing factor 38A